MFKNLKISTKLIVVSLLVGIVPLATIGFISMDKAGSSLEEAADNKLDALCAVKKSQIHDYFENCLDNMTMLGQSQDAQESFKAFKEYHDFMKVGPTEPFPINNEGYNQLCREHGELLSKYCKTYGYHDVFLMCAAHGHVLYTDAKESDLGAKESDLGANLSSSNLRTSGLGKCWAEVVRTNDTYLTDFAPYAPSNGEAAAFAGAPVLDPSTGKAIAVVALQLPIDQIDNIMQERSGMGESGEMYLVGQDLLMRSDSRFSTETTILKQKCDHETIKKALAGETGVTALPDYRGIEVVSAYAPVKVGNMDWAVIAETDVSELMAPTKELQAEVIIIGLIIGVIVAIIGWLFARTIMRPKKRLAPWNPVYRKLTRAVSCLTRPATVSTRS